MKNPIFISIVLMFLLTGCGDKDKAYYQSNLDDAEHKSIECQKSMEEAFKDKDEGKLKSISEDLECGFASEAMFEHKRKIAKIERELKAKEAKAQAKIKKAEFEAEYKKQIVELKNVSYSEFISIKCTAFRPDAKCKAFNELKKEREKSEVESISSKLSFEDIESKIANECSGSNAFNGLCNTHRIALRIKSEKEVEGLVQNKDKLVKVFNQCLAEYNKLRDLKKYNESVGYVNKSRCKFASQAAKKLGVYGWSRPIKL